MAGLEKRIRTIVVDDSPIFLKLMSALVARQGLALIGTATNGRAALAMARNLQPDLVLMDLEMPIMDGIKATSCLQQECPATSVVIVTGDDNEDQRSVCLQSGARGFIPKSRLNDELSVVVQELFRNGKSE